jgi:hypothetical protein
VPEIVATAVVAASESYVKWLCEEMDRKSS